MVTKAERKSILAAVEELAKGAPDAKPKQLIELACKQLKLDFDQVLPAGKERKSLYATVQNELTRRKIEKSSGEIESNDQEKDGSEHNQALGKLTQETKEDVLKAVDDKVAGLAKSMDERVGKLQATLEQAITRPPDGANSSAVGMAAAGTMHIDMPSNPMTVQISPMTQVYYAIARQKLQDEHPDSEPAPLGDFINSCVKYWFEAHGFRISIFDFNRRDVEFGSGPG